MFFKNFIFFIMLLISYFSVTLIPYKTLIPIAFVLATSFMIFPMFCSLFKKKLFYYFKHQYINILKTGFLTTVIFFSSNVFFMLPFSLVLKLIFTTSKIYLFSLFQV